MLMASLIVPLSSNGSCVNSSPPLSCLVKSSKSLMTCTSDLLASCVRRKFSLTAPSVDASSAISRKLTIAFSGVRTSCDALASNKDVTELAWTALSFSRHTLMKRE